MSRILITGSSDGLGAMAARKLVGEGHEVTLHARDEHRARDAADAVPGAAGVVIGDLATTAATRLVAEQANETGPFDAVIHNAGVGYREPRRIATADGLAHVFAINVLAPYLLTALIHPPIRLVYISSGMARAGSARLDDPQWTHRRWNGAQAYSDSKLLDIVLARAVARRWPHVCSNSVEPGWVPTRMGGPGAPDDLALAPVTQAWLAAGTSRDTQTTAKHFYHQRPRNVPADADSEKAHEELLSYCAELSGVPLPPS